MAGSRKGKFARAVQEMLLSVRCNEWATDSYLATLMDCSERQVKRYLAVLRKAGCLKSIRSRHKLGGGWVNSRRFVVLKECYSDADARAGDCAPSVDGTLGVSDGSPGDLLATNLLVLPTLLDPVALGSGNDGMLRRVRSCVVAALMERAPVDAELATVEEHARAGERWARERLSEERQRQHEDAHRMAQQIDGQHILDTLARFEDEGADGHDRAVQALADEALAQLLAERRPAGS